MATATEITPSSAHGPVTIVSVTYGYNSYNSVGPAPASACGGDVASRASAERSSPSTRALVSALSHDKSVDFLHHRVLCQPIETHLNNYSK
jgi:hypothetical protein